MKSVGIREAKTHLSALARAAAKGEPVLLTDYGQPLAMITSLERDGARAATSDPAEFREALLGLPHALELDF